jgi:hypothetical protein
VVTTYKVATKKILTGEFTFSSEEADGYLERYPPIHEELRPDLENG